MRCQFCLKIKFSIEFGLSVSKKWYSPKLHLLSRQEKRFRRYE